jgi:hypothetical protein
MEPNTPESVQADRAGAARRPALLRRLLLIVAAWGIAAYLIAPRLWEVYFRGHQDYADAPRVTHTSDGHPGDPVNIALVASEEEVVAAMGAADWFPADPITLKTSLRIAADSVLRRPDENAPVSNLFLFGRKEDLAFEQPAGDSPRQRHHVRYWLWDKTDDGKHVWFGAATYDERVGLSYTTGEVTHHIGDDVDAERNRIATELVGAGCARETRSIDGFHSVREARNGGGDIWRTDGSLAVLDLQPCSRGPAHPK